MPRKKKQRRKKGAGSLVKRNGVYCLRLNVDGKIKVRTIRDEFGSAVSSKEIAESMAEDVAQAIREEIVLNRKNQASTPLAEVPALYLQHLPTYSKRRGKLHIEATRTTRLSPATLEINKSSLNQFLTWLRKEGIATLKEIEHKHASAFMATKAEKKESTYNRHLMALRAVFDTIPQTRERNPFKTVEARSLQAVREDTAKKRRFERDELITMQERATGWIRCAMYVGYHTGKRMGDVVCLQYSSIDQRGFFSGIDRKTGKQDEVFAPEALPALAEWQQQRLLDWNRGNLTNTRYLAKVFNISPATALKVKSALESDTFASIDVWQSEMREAIKASGIRQTTQMKHFVCGAAGLPLDEIPESLQDFVFPRQAAAYLGIGRKRDRSAPAKEFQAFLSTTCQFNTKNADGQTVLGFHSLRVSNATYGKIAGQGIEDIQKRLAHSNQSITNGYIQRELEEVRAELVQQHKPLEFPGLLASRVEPTSTRADLEDMIRSLSDDEIRQLLNRANR